MNLTGTWKGKYIYGKGYPAGIIGQSGPFEFDISDKEGMLTGTCMDDVVRKTPGNESTIDGVFKDGYISFLKTYKYHTVVGVSHMDDPFERVQSEGVQYTGELRKTFFTRSVYFKGEWSITTAYMERATGRLVYYTVHGTWTMKKG